MFYNFYKAGSFTCKFLLSFSLCIYAFILLIYLFFYLAKKNTRIDIVCRNILMLFMYFITLFFHSIKDYLDK